MRIFILLIGIILFFNHAVEAFAIEGPKGWEKIDDASQLPSKVKVVYVGPGKGQVTPSINLAVEETGLSLDQYIEEAKSYHEKMAENKVTRLGKMATQSGDAEILQIDRITSWGQVRFIQAALKIESRAYVITATCLEEEFGQISRAIFQTIKSFNCLAQKK